MASGSRAVQNRSTSAGGSLSKEWESGLGAFAEACVDAFILFDEDLNLLGINPAGQRLVGISSATARAGVGKNLRELVPDIQKTGRYGKYLEVLRTGKPLVVDDVIPHPMFGDIQLSVKAFKVGKGLGVIASDITERKRVEQALRDSEEQLESFMESATESFLLLDSELRISEVNKTALERWGVTREEVIGKSIAELWPAATESGRVEKYKEVLKTGVPKYIEQDFDHPKFAGRHIAMKLFKAGDGLGIIAADITERRQMEEALIQSEEWHKALVETPGKAGLGIEIVQNTALKEATIVFVNDEYCKMLGYSREELLTMSEWDVIAGGELESVKDKYRRRQRGEPVSSLYETMLVRKDGTLLPIETSVSLMNYRGRVATVSYFRDISERKKAEEALRESEEHYSALVSSLTDAVFKVKGATITWCNDRVEEIYGYSKEELLGKDVSLIFPKDIKPQDFAREVSRAITGHGLFWGTTKFEKKDGSLVDIEYSISQIPGRRPVELVAVARDVTERIRFEDQLRSSHEQLRQLSAHLQSVKEEEAKRIAREVHDDLGQTLTALKMDLSWLTKRLNRERESLLDKAESMSRLIDTALQTVKRISATLRPGLLDELGLTATIEWQVEEFQNLTGIKTEFLSNPKEIVVDQDRSITIFRICQEALRNIARHANATRVRMNLEEKSGNLELRVRDNGRGITQEQILDPKSFGLIGIRERAYFWGGDVKITGTAGKGTTVTVSVPLDEK